MNKRFIVKLNNGNFYGKFGKEYNSVNKECEWHFKSKKELKEVLDNYGYENYSIIKLR